eukprot:TRINITY_DN14139_c0_g1_i1.p1 TRINITY_DN14139_c0_g1~~TRINITY_DN14139_c0_g1_i1.p1  ORF type:complete len:2980 (-),score=351.33 TRINITY_DN14139_c0_g1_i1:81-9020(-)
MYPNDFRCNLECDSVPVGYQKLPEGWRCAEGFGGDAHKTCDICGAPPVYSGCKPLMPCVPIRRGEGRLADECMYEPVGCEGVMPGNACQVQCRPHYVGEPTQASCPAGNTDPTQELSFELPNCTLKCPLPDPIPDGYALEGETWRCAEGYIGDAETDCSLYPGCMAKLNLTGCIKLQPCIVPAVAAHLYDLSSCSSIEPGQECEVRCRHPFVGEPTMNLCPAGNIDPTTPLVGALPDCRPFCDNIPPGYQKLEDGWSCAEGYLGNVTKSCVNTTRCVKELFFEGCKKIVPCRVHEVDRCRYDLSSCPDTISLGDGCTATCTGPYTAGGPPRRLTCPYTNTDPDGGLTGDMPICNLACDDPVQEPPGYVRVSGGGWACAPFYKGQVRKRCVTSPFPNCTVLEGILEGCEPTRECAPFDAEAYGCRYDAPSCERQLDPGETCEVLCRKPLVGNVSATSMCPANNLQQKGPLELNFPTCECPGPETIPPGYEEVMSESCVDDCNTSAADRGGESNLQCTRQCSNVSTGEWRCAPGYSGVANATCEFACKGPGCTACSAELVLRGCDPLRSCAVASLVPPLDHCQYDVRDALWPGTSSAVSCKSPYVGNATTTATCPEGNTDASSPPILDDLPSCQLICPLVNITGYVALDHDSYECAPGYGGAVVSQCVLNQTTCEPTLLLSGCHPLQPCVAPQVDKCQMNVSTCEGLAPGGMCEISCLPPYVGEPSSGTCPGDNTDATQAVLFSPPACRLVCSPATLEWIEEPLSPLTGSQDVAARVQQWDNAGYVESASGWQCKSGFVGEAYENCTINENCVASSFLTGCDKVYPCLPIELDPEVYERIFEGWCPNWKEGSSNGVGIGKSYWPDPPSQEWCFQQCDKDPLCEQAVYEAIGTWGPECWIGLNKMDTKPTGSRRKGFFPNVDFCYSKAGFLVRQVPLERCRWSIASCVSTEHDSSCEVSCRPPYLPGGTPAYCPANNTNPALEMIWTRPQCQCPDPSPIPPGYVKNETTGEWSCGPGFVETPDKNGELKANATCILDCTITDDCNVTVTNETDACECCSAKLKLEGCVVGDPCTVTNPDICMYDFSDCDGTKPGIECVVRCKSPYESVVPGTVGRGFCPGGIENSGAPLKYELPDCWILSCPDDPIEPRGYQKDTAAAVGLPPWHAADWICSDADDYAGDAYKECTMGPAPTCQTSYVLKGCKPRQNCTQLDARTADTCKFDASDCEKNTLFPGSTCLIGCRLPYLGNDTSVATCPTDNTAPNGQVEFEPPECFLECPELATQPPGYTKVNNIWVCAAGYIGSPVVTCSVDGVYYEETKTTQCETRVQLSGCNELMPCKLPELDKCQYDLSECGDVRDGATCTIGCKDPYITGASLGTGVCPAGNLDPNEPLRVILPECELTCPDPPSTSFLYSRYEKIGNTSEWRCTPRHSGFQSATCSINPNNCESKLVLIGCLPEEACLPLDIRDGYCKVDSSSCDNVWAGESCTVECIPPCYGVPGKASCPAGNVIPGRSLEIQESTCVFDCDDLPSGYTKTEQGWVCAPGYTGNVLEGCKAGMVCENELTLDGCVPVQPCGPPRLSRIMFDFDSDASCAALPAGGSCEVKCRLPYEGPPTVASCPATNSVEGTPAIWSPASRPCIVYVCPDPEEAVGYTRSNSTATGWVCAEGYTGFVTRACEQGGSPVAILSGCQIEVPCPGIRPQNQYHFGIVDTCRHNITDCDYSVGSGDSCEVPCRPPYVGESTFATCPPQNLDPFLYVSWTPAICELACPVPELIPAGYVWTGELPRSLPESRWTCADGYYGNASEECIIDETCYAWPNLTGCEKQYSCGAPDVDPCKYDVSDCASVPPGGTCTIRCLSPWSGGFSIATCPLDANEPNTSVVWTEPPCTLDEVCKVTHPDPRPPGYKRMVDDSYSCFNGYAGNVTKTCTQRSDCVIIATVKGCFPMQYCAAPDQRSLDECVYNVSSCSHVNPADKCLIGCSRPYVGTPTEANCKAGNIDSLTKLNYTIPTCTMDCPDPPVDPPGYVRTADLARFPLGWRCAEGYLGMPRRHCDIKKMWVPVPQLDRPGGPQGITTCDVTPMLLGCEKLTPCAPLDVYHCMVDADDCRQVWGGLVCRSFCKPPYTGDGIFKARCPWGNTNTTQQPLWTDTAPVCGLSCPYPDPMPTGYALHGSNFSCAEGYIGTVEALCTTNKKTCSAEYVLTGCHKLVPCLLPPADPCMADFSDCGDTVPEGGSCSIGCRGPHYVGESKMHAICPKGNIDPTTVATLTGTLECTLTCPNPRPSPAGYTLYDVIVPPDNTTNISELTPNETLEYTEYRWRCAEGYEGFPKKTCTIDAQCQVGAVMSECRTLVPCAPLVGQACQYDTTECARVLPGKTCSIRCRLPAKGTPTIARCPAGNRLPTTPLNFTLPICARDDCDNTELNGYARRPDGWECGTGYAGRIVAGCKTDAACNPQPSLEGCFTKQACAPLLVEDKCRFDVSECQSLFAGKNCSVKCRAPYVGTPTISTCPWNNTDASTPLNWTRPVCTIEDCPDPKKAPLGFVKKNGRWMCAPGYTGIASKRCSVDGRCNLREGELFGCIGLSPCIAPELDKCKHNVTNCSGVLFGDSCELRCQPPYKGDPTSAFCPRDNTDRYAVVRHEVPECTLECPDPDEPPEGYRRMWNGQWVCAEGYVGKAIKSCSVDKWYCKVEVSLAGCLKRRPCQTLKTYDCALDVTDCYSVDAGKKCEVRCLPPHEGEPVEAVCPDDNTNPNQPLIFTPPKCECINPDPEPEGYEFFMSQIWVCAGGYVGRPRKVCRKSFTECMDRTILLDCVLSRPCGAARFMDEEREKGYISGKFSFGPAEQDGVLLEDSILDYWIYFQDECGKNLDLIGKVPVRKGGEFHPACCPDDYYSLDIDNVSLPPTATWISVFTSTRFGQGKVGASVRVVDKIGGYIAPPATSPGDGGGGIKIFNAKAVRSRGLPPVLLAPVVMLLVLCTASTLP